jgi:hypothetical protein
MLLMIQKRLAAVGWIWVVIGSCTGSGSVLGQPLPGASPAPLPGGMSKDAFAGAMRGLLIRHLPQPLYEDSDNWGKTRPAISSIHWEGKGLKKRPVVYHREKKDGLWKKIVVTSDDLADTLIFDLRNLQQLGPGRMTFDLFMSLDVKVDYRRQRWESGLEISDLHARARLRLKFYLHCEATSRLEKNDSLIPDWVVRLRVLSANVKYDNFQLEHVAGIGGEAAQILGDVVEGAIKEWNPSLERKLLEKANAAIVKAGDTKEIRLSLMDLLK